MGLPNPSAPSNQLWLDSYLDVLDQMPFHGTAPHIHQREVKPSNRAGAYRVTIPPEWLRNEGVDREEPLPQKVYYDPVLGVVFFDLRGVFE